MGASWGLFKTLLVSVLTLGVGPLLVWPRRLRDLIRGEQAQFQHLAEWMRARSGYPYDDRLLSAANVIRPHVMFSYLPPLIAVMTAGAVIVMLGDANFPRSGLLPSTIGYGRANAVYQSLAMDIHLVWTIGLSAAYLMHWFQLMLHLSNVRSAVRAFNALSASEGIGPVPEPGGGGLRPMWLGTSVLMIVFVSAAWAVPMMLAGALQRRYATISGPAMRGAIAERLRHLLSHQRPMMRVPTQVSLPRRCPNDRCRSAIARIANFCPRCGTHVGPEVDAIA